MSDPTAPGSPAARHGIGRRPFVVAALGAGLTAAAAHVTASAGPAGRRVSSAARHQVGGLEVIALLDASGPFPAAWTEMFPDATDTDWAAARAIDPAAFGDDGRWHLDFHCYAVRRPSGRVMLVDSGVGPAGSPASGWAPVPGRLPRALTEAGIAAGDVDLVVMTHLHEDHVGWAVGPDGTPMFPDARYLVQRDEVDHLAGDPGSVVWGYVVEPLLRTGQLHQVRGAARLPAGRRGERVLAVPTPGHTVGHQSVVVGGPRDEVIITGDVLVHAVQLADPGVAYALENDQATARATRRALLRRAERADAVLATAHLHTPFVRSRQGR
ncbi:MBL fold metallo-hydrolase [Jiangella muralis]|uniref:MBL fold metallo-hydrolase n=1 Tax=Jiangella muralis TaxID=702383 RepID=UPI0009F8B9F2|nr:MBL fold metallo-hydrolase [Jiangella muralis]